MFDDDPGLNPDDPIGEAVYNGENSITITGGSSSYRLFFVMLEQGRLKIQGTPAELSIFLAII